jgi:hypothetical protein
MVAAELAYRQLGVAERAKALAILTAAFADPDGEGLKRFKEDLTAGLPADASAADRDHSIILRAAIWPDVIRDPTHPLHLEFHKPLWHFINYPFVPVGDSLPLPPDPVPTAAGQEPQDVISAIGKCIADVRAPTTSKRNRAAQLCFLLHTVGDIHQPLHAAAMFSADKLTHGDMGGNALLVRVPGIGHSDDHLTSIHAIFDELFGSKTQLDAIVALADAIDHKPQFQRVALANFLQNADHVAWAKESRDDAVKVAYLNGSLNAFRGKTVGQFAHEHLNPDDVPLMPHDYQLNAHPVAEKRIALAGHRLADILSALLQ